MMSVWGRRPFRVIYDIFFLNAMKDAKKKNEDFSFPSVRVHNRSKTYPTPEYPSRQYKHKELSSPSSQKIYHVLNTTCNFWNYSMNMYTHGSDWLKRL